MLSLFTFADWVIIASVVLALLGLGGIIALLIKGWMK